MGFHSFVRCDHAGCSFCEPVTLYPAPKEPTVMDFPLEAKFVWQTLEQLRDLDAEHFQELAPKYLELVIRRAATQAARGVVSEEREFEGEVRKAIEHMEVILGSLKLTVETL